MNETQKPKRKYGNYCLRSANGEKKRKCHTGECVDYIKKVPGVKSKRCPKGTRKCSDQRCYSFTKKSKNPISKQPFKIIKDKPETLSNNSSKLSSGDEVKVHPFISEEEQYQQEPEYIFPQPNSRNSKRKKSKPSKPSKKNYTSHGKYGNKRKPFTIPPTETQEDFQPIPTQQISSLNLPVINNTNTKKSKRKSRKRRRKGSKNIQSPIVSKPISLSPPLQVETVNSSSLTPKVEQINSSYKPLLLENGKEENEPLIDVEELEEKEEEGQEDMEEGQGDMEEERQEDMEEERQEDMEEERQEEEEGQEEEGQEGQEEEEGQEEGDLQPIELLSQSPPSSPARKSSSPPRKLSSPLKPIEPLEEEEQEEQEGQEEVEEKLNPMEEEESEPSIGSIKSENSSGGKKHSKKHYKKKSKKPRKKQSKKKSKKHYKKKSRKRSKK